MPVQSTPTTARPAPFRVPYLDGIRALAALFVVVHHCYCMAYPVGDGVQISDRGRWVLGWALYGHFGVTVFIVLAGFSLGLGLDARTGAVRGGLAAFARRRAWRILPSYWIAIAVTIVLVLTVIGTKTGTHWDLSLPIDPKGWAVDALLLQDVWLVMPIGNVSYPFWSISVEWHIYLLIPFVVLLRRVLSWRPVLLIGCGLAVAGMVVGQVKAPVAYLQPAYYLLFLLGVGASVLVRSPKFTASRTPWAGLATVVLLAVGVICATHSFAWFSSSLWWLDAVFGIGVLAAILALQATGSVGSGRLRAMLAAPIMRTAAASSFTLYLLHAPMLQLFWQAAVLPFHLPRIAQLALGWGVAVPTIVLVCALCARVMERPFVRRSSGVGRAVLPAPTRAVSRERPRIQAKIVG